MRVLVHGGSCAGGLRRGLGGRGVSRRCGRLFCSPAPLGSGVPESGKLRMLGLLALLALHPRAPVLKSVGVRAPRVLPRCGVRRSSDADGAAGQKRDARDQPASLRTGAVRAGLRRIAGDGEALYEPFKDKDAVLAAVLVDWQGHPLCVVVCIQVPAQRWVNLSASAPRWRPLLEERCSAFSTRQCNGGLAHTSNAMPSLST